DFEILPGEHVLVVDDILTTGSSVRETISAIDKLGGIVIGVGVLVNRSERNLDFDLPFFSCLRAPTTVYTPEQCPLCVAKVPLVKPGTPG
ncbi:MAG: orotate phosphoribosyltransferase, partial [Chloroflexi bacterium]